MVRLLPFLTLCLPLNAMGQAAASKELAAMDATLMSLKSGIVRVEGTTVETFRDKRRRTSDNNFLMAFDFEKGYLRCERPDNKHTFLRTPEATYRLWPNPAGDNQTSVSKYDLDWVPPPSHINPFDVRQLGFFTCYGSYYSSRGYAGTRNYLSNIGRVVATERQDSQTALMIHHRDADDGHNDKYATFNITLDTGKASTPTRIAVSDFQVSLLDWNLVNGTLVPTRFRQDYHPQTSGLQINVDWALSWESVNEEIPRKLFSVESLGREGDRNGVIYDGEAGGDKPVVVDYFATPTEPKPEPPKPRLPITMLLAGLAFLAFAMACIALASPKPRGK